MAARRRPGHYYCVLCSELSNVDQAAGEGVEQAASEYVAQAAMEDAYHGGGR